MSSEALRELLPLLLPIFLLQLGLLAAALVDLARRERVRFGNKLVWAVVIIFVSTLGPLAYFAVGREEG